MYRHKFYPVIVAIAALLLVNPTGCTDDVVRHQADDTPDFRVTSTPGNLAQGVGNAPKMVPFKGSGTWQVVGFEPVVEDNVMMVFVELEGNATHLGRFQWEMTAHYVLLILEDEDGNPIYYKTDYLSHSSIFTAANGDELYDEGCVDEHGTVNEPDEFFGFFMTGNQLVEGTGRFENAVGVYDWLVIATVPPDPPDQFPAGTWEMDGEISSVGSARSARRGR